MNKINKNEIAVIDLFCGIGGISHGFVQEGFNVVAGYDNEVSCKYAFETNNNAKFYNEDISKLQGTQLNEEFGDVYDEVYKQHKENPISAEVILMFVKAIQEFVDATWYDPSEALKGGAFV